LLTANNSEDGYAIRPGVAQDLGQLPDQHTTIARVLAGMRIHGKAPCLSASAERDHVPGGGAAAGARSKQRLSRRVVRHPPSNVIGEIKHDRDVILRLFVFGPHGRHERENTPTVGGEIEVRHNAGISKPVLRPLPQRTDGK
jgi:hypothetical protein